MEWVVISFSRGSSRPRDRTLVSCIAGGFFTAEAPGKEALRFPEFLSHVLSPPQDPCQYITRHSALSPEAPLDRDNSIGTLCLQ